MRFARLAIVAAGWLAPCTAFGADSAPASASDDRIALSANGSTLPGTNGGGGASAAWLHNFDADTLAGVAVEHQVISIAHWTFGSLNGSLSREIGDARYSFYGEAHEGAGDDGSTSSPRSTCGTDMENITEGQRDAIAAREVLVVGDQSQLASQAR